MTKLTVKTVDGWPLMEPLERKESDLLQRNMVSNERILGLVMGNFGQAIIATDHKVLVVKTGLMADQTFGDKATSFDYRTIVGVEVRTGFSQGEFEIIAASMVVSQCNRNKDKIAVNESPNGVVFPKSNGRLFAKMAAKIREMTAVAHGAGTAINPQPTLPTAGSSIPERIRSLAELHAAGILTDSEFTTKKEELLARM